MSSEPYLDQARQVVRSAAVQAEIAGFLNSGPSVLLIVRCGHAFPVGASVRFRWEGNSGTARVEDCFTDGTRYVLWLETEAATMARGLANCFAL